MTDKKQTPEVIIFDTIEEDAPTNHASASSVAGIGSDPPVRKKKKSVGGIIAGLIRRKMGG